MQFSDCCSLVCESAAQQPENGQTCAFCHSSAIIEDLDPFHSLILQSAAISPELKDLIGKMLVKDPAERITLPEIKVVLSHFSPIFVWREIQIRARAHFPSFIPG